MCPIFAVVATLNLSVRVESDCAKSPTRSVMARTKTAAKTSIVVCPGSVNKTPPVISISSVIYPETPLTMRSAAPALASAIRENAVFSAEIPTAWNTKATTSVCVSAASVGLCAKANARTLLRVARLCTPAVFRPSPTGNSVKPLAAGHPALLLVAKRQLRGWQDLLQRDDSWHGVRAGPIFDHVCL